MCMHYLQVNAIIEEASKGSKFYEHKANAQKRIDVKKDSMKNRMKTLSNEEIELANMKADKVIQEIKETETDTSKVIVHVDMVSIKYSAKIFYQKSSLHAFFNFRICFMQQLRKEMILP